ncbi:MAG: ribosome recycling factor [Candidatus Aegiribacteria sp. MLS_C]|nr:MAG: ribosome recycling factor [Candidatus Aegiribacteria sp. MLS_C]
MIDELMKDIRSRMKAAVDSTAREMAVIRTGKASPALLDNLRVECWGGLHPIKQVAGISAPEARLIVIQPFDPSTSDAIVRAIQKSDLGLRASADGPVIRIPVPKLSDERRQELDRLVKKLAEQGRTSIRNVRRSGNDELHRARKDSEITEDEEHSGMAEVQEAADGAIAEIDRFLEAKEKEILEV